VEVVLWKSQRIAFTKMGSTGSAVPHTAATGVGDSLPVHLPAKVANSKEPWAGKIAGGGNQQGDKFSRNEPGRCQKQATTKESGRPNPGRPQQEIESLGWQSINPAANIDTRSQTEAATLAEAVAVPVQWQPWPIGAPKYRSPCSPGFAGGSSSRSKHPRPMPATLGADGQPLVRMAILSYTGQCATASTARPNSKTLLD